MKGHIACHTGHFGPSWAAADRLEALSQREVDVLRLLARGSANKQIARDLGIAEKTVKTHVSNILGKLDVQSRTQAARYAGRICLAPLDKLGQASTNGKTQRSGGGS